MAAASASASASGRRGSGGYVRGAAKKGRQAAKIAQDRLAREKAAVKKDKDGGVGRAQMARNMHARHRDKRTKATDDEDAAATYPLKNYRPTLLLVLAQMGCTFLLFLILFTPPNLTNAVIVSGGEVVGFFKRCEGSQCTDFMQMDGAKSESSETSTGTEGGSGGGIAGAASGLLRRQLAGGGGGESAGGGESSASSGETAGGAPDYSNLPSPIGSVLLVVFYGSLYCSLFLAIRYPLRIARPTGPPDPPTVEEHEMQQMGKAKGDVESLDADQKDERTRWDRLKLFTYRASRSLQISNSLLLFIFWAWTAYVVVQAQGVLQLSGVEGVGGGMYLLSIAFGASLYCTTVEFAKNGGRLRLWLSFSFVLDKIPWCRDTVDPPTETDGQDAKTGESTRRDAGSSPPPPKYSKALIRATPEPSTQLQRKPKATRQHSAFSIEEVGSSPYRAPKERSGRL